MRSLSFVIRRARLRQGERTHAPYTMATLARFTKTGAIDTSFGTSGRLTPSLVAGGTSQQLDELGVDEDGQIIAAGYVNSGGPLVVATRYTTDGVIDASFGIVVLGATPRGAGGADLAMWRFWP
jgi:hypothetical protein